MKRLMLVVTLFIGFQFMSTAQVTKADVLQMMKNVGTSEAQITTLYVGNILTFYTDGSYKRTTEKYNKTYKTYENTIEIIDSGVLLKTTKDGKPSTNKLFPFKSMNTISVSVAGIDIYLKD